MGCDIHLFIQYKKKETTSWRAHARSALELPRNYRMFGCLARGVRCDIPGASNDAKGIPTDLNDGWTEDELTYVVDEDGPGDTCVPNAKAEEWVAKGSSIWWRGNFLKRITRPDWHTHSWLTLPEYLEACILYCQDTNDIIDLPVEYYVIKKILKAYTKKGYDARVVFWFDN